MEKAGWWALLAGCLVGLAVLVHWKLVIVLIVLALMVIAVHALVN